MGICSLNGHIIDYTHHLDEIIHDLNTPVQSLKMLLLTSSRDFSRDKRVLAKEAFERIEYLMEKFSQYESRKGSFLLLPFLKTTIQIKQWECRRKAVALYLEWDREVEDLVVSIDQGELSRIIFNLLNNAQEAFHDEKVKKRIRLMVSIKNNDLVIEIQDNGHGISPLSLSSFHRHRSFKKKGRGLGLAHAKKAMEFLNGKFHINSVLNKYTSVFLIFPLKTYSNL